MRRLRVLLIAEAANPDWTSVPLIGWELSQALSKIVDAHLVTQVRNRQAVLQRGLVEGRDFTAIDNEAQAARLYSQATALRGGAGKGWTTISAFSSLAYYSFEANVWERFERRLRDGDFDLVHRITPLSPTNQSSLAKRLHKLNIPFVIGPLNGGVPWPKSFRGRQNAEREWLSYVRQLYKLMPAYNATRRYSSAIIVGSRYTEQDMPAWAREKCIYIPENAVNSNLFGRPRDSRSSTDLRGIFIGRLVPYKGADVLIRAAAPFLRSGRLKKIDIVGDGPQRAELVDLAKCEGVSGAVEFHGWVPHAQVQDRLRVCDFLALPSVREFGGGVVLEAMALAVTPIVANYAGPSELVDDQTGIRVSFDNETSLVAGFQEAFEMIVRSPERLNQLGAAARAKVLSKFTWQAKAQQILKIYSAVLEKDSNLRALSLD